MHELVEFGFGRQLAVDQQISDLEEAGLLRELVNRVSAVEQDARIAERMNGEGQE